MECAHTKADSISPTVPPKLCLRTFSPEVTIYLTGGTYQEGWEKRRITHTTNHHEAATVSSLVQFLSHPTCFTRLPDDLVDPNLVMDWFNLLTRRLVWICID